MFASSADCFQNIFFGNLVLGIHIRVSNNLEPYQARRNVGPDLAPNCLQRLSADDISR